MNRRLMCAVCSVLVLALAARAEVLVSFNGDYVSGNTAGMRCAFSLSASSAAKTHTVPLSTV
mgnify:CR=1 FL=1